MKIAFFSPYLTQKHAGGGEKHLFDTALAAAKLGAEIYVAISPLNQAKNKLQLDDYRRFYSQFMGRDLSKLKFVQIPLMTSENILKKLSWTKQFDQLYYVTDGSLFFSLAKRNHLHIQVPFTHKLTQLNRLKLKNWQINTNSAFTQKVIEHYWQVKVNSIHYPLVKLDEFKSKEIKKEKLILSVGRFFKQLHSKRQDVLVEAFVRLVEAEPKLMKDWRLVLVGDVEDKVYFNHVRKLARSLPVEFYHQIKRQDLITLFKKATFYWHAAGFKVDELKHPEKVEHFGITTIEAIAAGALPLVVPKGGQKEILGDKLVSELGWQTVDELVKKTARLIKDKRLASLKLGEAGGSKEDKRLGLKKKLTPFTQEAFDRRVKQMFGL